MEAMELRLFNYEEFKKHRTIWTDIILKLLKQKSNEPRGEKNELLQ